MAGSYPAFNDNEFNLLKKLVDNVATLVDNGGGGSLPPQTGHAGEFLTTNGTIASWTVVSGTGSVTSVAVATANGFAGTVANPSTTASITLRTTVTGILAGNGTAVAAAVAGDFPTLNQNTTGSAATLTTSRNINGVAFNGSADITVTAAAGTLTGTTLNATVVTSSLTSVGTIATGTWSATTIAVNKGGTGLAVYVVGDLIQASATTTLATLAAVATGNVLISGGVGTISSWGKVGISTHVSGLGTGVATALAVNVGSAGAFVTFNGALGTPSSGTVTNLTGTASININGTVGATTPAAGTFSALTDTANTFTIGSTARTIVTGAGTPEASITASIGALYLRNDGGAGTSLYTKTSGTGNTGWTAVGTGGSGTVTVVSSGSLTSTALVTGGGTTTLQTPSATATMDSSGNISTPGSVSTGVGSGVAGAMEFTQGTAPTAGTTSIKIYAPASVTSYIRNLPATAGTGFYLGTNSSGVVTDTQVASNGSGNVLLSAGTAAIASGKTLTVSNTLTFTGTDSSSVAFGAGGTVMYNPMTTGGDIIYGGASGVPTRLTNGSAGQVLTSAGGTSAPTWSAAGSGDMVLASVQTVTGAKTFGTIGGAVGKFILAGSTSGSTIVNAAATAGSTTITLPAATDTLVGKATTDTFTNKTFDTAGTGNSFSINSVAVTANTGTGAVARATSPTFVTPTLGAATATTINGNTFTTGTYTLTGTAGKTLNFTNTITFSGTDSTTMTFPSTTATIARTDAAQTFTGVQTFTSITLVTNGQILLTVPTTDGHATGPTCNAFNSGYTSSAVGDLVYLDSSSTWQKCDANTLLLYNGLLGIALAVVASGNPLLVALPGSFVYAVAAFPTFTIGGPVYMSETAGAVTQTAPTTTDAATRVLGHAVHADKMYFNPSPTYITHT